jgi:hypothetical protein
MAVLIDLGKISKGITGVVDIFGRLAKSLEKAIQSGLRSSDIIRHARERKRLRNFMLLTAHLYVVQGRLVSQISAFCAAPEDRGTWEQAKFEILAINRLLTTSLGPRPTPSPPRLRLSIRLRNGSCESGEAERHWRCL